MATAKKKVPAKRAAAASKKAAAKKPAAKKPAAKKAAAASKKPAKGGFFSDAKNYLDEQWDDFVGSAKVKAKEVAAQEKLLEKKAELAAKAEMDKVRHLATQAEKWMKARVKSDTKKLNALEKKLTKQLRATQRKLKSQARAAEKKASRQGKALQKKLDAGARQVLAHAPPKVRAKVAGAKKKAASAKTKAAPKT